MTRRTLTGCIEGTGYEDLLLEQVGDFTLQAGQHCVTYETSDELSDGQYYLTMYNNNNATISTRDYDYDVEAPLRQMNLIRTTT